MGQEHCDLFSFTKLQKRLHHSKTMNLTVVSGSMEPLIPIGSTICVRAISQELSPYDIVVFWDGGRLVSHYVWKKSAFKTDGETLWITRSLQDLESNDLPVKGIHILGIIDNYKLTTIHKIKVLFHAWRKGRL